MEKEIVTSFLLNSGKILIMKRSRLVGMHKGKYAAVSGFLDRNATPLAQALAEIREETGIGKENLELIKKGEKLIVDDKEFGLTWIIHPFIFSSDTIYVKMNWENDDYKWIDPKEMEKYNCIQGLRDILVSLIK